MKGKQLLAKILSVSVIVSSGILLTGCGAGTSQTAAATAAIPESPIGIYTNVQDFDDVSSRLVGTHAMMGERETVGLLSSLTVYRSATAIQLDENNYAVKDADGEIIHVDNTDENNVFYKYVFAKNSIVAGESFLVYNRGQYTGYCTYDVETGTLTMYTPEYFMTYTTNRRELDNWPESVTNTKVTEEVLANPSSGLSFASEWQAHGGNTLPEPMKVILSANTQFSYVSQYLAEDSAQGNNYNYQFEDYSHLYQNHNNEGGN